MGPSRRTLKDARGLDPGARAAFSALHHVMGITTYPDLEDVSLSQPVAEPRSGATSGDDAV